MTLLGLGFFGVNPPPHLSIFQVDITPRLKVTNVVDPPVRQSGDKVPDVDTLIAKLIEKGHLKA